MNKLFSLIIFCCLLSGGLQAQTTDEQLKWVIDELKLNQERILPDLATEKRHPANADLSIVCIPAIVEYTCGEECWTADVYVAILNKKSKKITYHNFTRSLNSDAIYPTRIWIDTAPYKVSPTERAFAIRIESTNNSRAASLLGEDFWLMLAMDNTIVRLLQVDSKTFVSYGGGDCENTEMHKQISTFALSDQVNDKGYFDLIEKVSYQHYFLNEECDDGEKEIKNFRNTFRYSDGQYLPVGTREKGW